MEQSSRWISSLFGDDTVKHPVLGLGEGVVVDECRGHVGRKERISDLKPGGQIEAKFDNVQCPGDAIEHD